MTAEQKGNAADAAMVDGVISTQAELDSTINSIDGESLKKDVYLSEHVSQGARNTPAEKGGWQIA